MPTYGYTTGGGSGGTFNFQVTVCNMSHLMSPGAGETLDTIYYYGLGSTPQSCDIGVYDVSGGVPVNVVNQTTTGTISTLGWYNVSVSVALSSGTDYSFAWENNGVNTIQYRYDTGSAGDMSRDNGAFPDPYAEKTTFARQVSLYGVTSAGGGTTDAAGDISSTATLTGEGASTVEAAASFVASASMTAEGAAQTDSELSITSTGQIDWVGESTANAEGAIDIQATSSFTAEGSATATSEIDIQASSTFTGEGESTAESEIDISSAAQVDWVGEAVAAGQAALGIAATSNFTAEGAASAEAEADISASSDITFGNEQVAEEEAVVNPAGGGGWTTWQAQAMIKDKKLRKLVEEDEELFRMISMMLPELVHEYYLRAGVSNLTRH